MAAEKLPDKQSDEPVAKEAQSTGSPRRWQNVPQQGIWILFAVAALSLLIHIGTGYELVRLGNLQDPLLQSQKKPPVKIKIVRTEPKEKKKPPKKAEEKPKPKDDIPGKILEAKQTKTEKPEEATHVGHTDHKAEKETRLDERIKRERAANAGVKGNPNAKRKSEKTVAKKPQKSQKAQTAIKPKIKTKSNIGSLSFDTLKRKARNAYEALLPSSITDLPGQLDAGYQDYVDDKIERGDRIDINTTQYRYIGYFTNMRKAIELVWNYPREASRKGMQGEVGLEFAIAKDGSTSRIKVLKSSGYEVLDRAIVEAIRLASPFSPLPDGFGKNRITVTGSFRYVLQGFGSH